MPAPARKVDDHQMDTSSGEPIPGIGLSTNQTPKAVVKPNVLTHVIDGHVIQESSQPFPLDNSDSKGRFHRTIAQRVEQLLLIIMFHSFKHGSLENY